MIEERAMVSQEDIAAQQELLAAYRRTLAQLLKQQALISELYAPPAITHGIDEARENIQRLKAILRSWDVLVEDLPDDEAPAAKQPIAAAPHAAPRRPLSRWLKRLAGALVLLLLASTLAFVLRDRKSAPVTYKPTAGSDIPQVQFGIAKNYFWDGTRYQEGS
jgi:hypothetical protein